MLNYKELPKGVFNINLVQIFSTTGFAVLLGLLNFYLYRHGLSHTEANTLTASFFALNFLFHMLAGTIGGRYLSFRALFLISLLLQVIGLFLIAFHTHSIILIGMAVFITGSGLNVSCINMMLTQLFSQDDKRRRIAFSINYSFMNIGFVLSFVIAGILQSYNLYSPAFIFAAVCIIISMLIHLKNWQYVADKGTLFASHASTSSGQYYKSAGIISACLIFAFFLMHYPRLASALIYIVFFIVIAFILRMAASQESHYRNKIYTYLVLSMASMIFACVQGLQSTALENFVEFNTTKSLFGIPMQPATVNLFESLGVILFGFTLASAMKKRQEMQRPYSPRYLVTKGLSLYVIAFLTIPFGIWISGTTQAINVLFPILLLVIVAAGEIHVNAVNYAMAGEMMKPEHQGLFTGYLFMNVAFGTNLAGPISNFALSNTTIAAALSPASTNPMYSKIFLTMAIAVTIITIGFFFMLSRIKNLIDTKKVEVVLESELE